jgi:uncharacterized membrane-anchored protein
MTTTGSDSRRPARREMLNKVPEVTLYFWVIKILATTVGETAADFLDGNLGLGLSKTTIVMVVVFIPVLVAQFWVRQYIPGIYWFAVVLISVVGTLITDNLSDNLGVSLVISTIGFAIALAVTFGVWYASERTLSIHTIVTTKREAFYWLAVLFTFALGTAAGDLTAERLAIGYWQSALIFAGAIAVVYVCHLRFALNAIAAFWIAYILTRPLGASIGDFLSQPRSAGGLGLGTTVTSALFLSTILAVVVFLSITKKDRIENRLLAERHAGRVAGAAAVLVVTNKMAPTAALLEAVRARAAASAAQFFVLVPNPDHLLFDRSGGDATRAEEILSVALPPLRTAAGTDVDVVVAASPNAYDDIVRELDDGSYDEIIIETPPTHVSHWLHVDLAHRLAHLGYRLTTVESSHDADDRHAPSHVSQEATPR